MHGRRRWCDEMSLHWVYNRTHFAFLTLNIVVNNVQHATHCLVSELITPKKTTCEALHMQSGRSHIYLDMKQIQYQNETPPFPLPFLV